MWSFFFFILIWFSTTQAVTLTDYCEDVPDKCHDRGGSWTRCYEGRITNCTFRRRFQSPSFRQRVNSSQPAEVGPTPDHKVYIPSSALQRSKAVSEEEVLLVATVISSTYFKLSPPQTKARGGAPIHKQSGTVMGGLVLLVKAGAHSVRNLTEPIKLTFRHHKKVETGTCVFWQELSLKEGTGYWSKDGCETSDSGAEFICTCNHLSFFAVLVNPILSVDERNSMALGYITYIGSALSILFLIISLIIFICLRRHRPEKVIGVHMQLAVALLCLHLSFLLSTLIVWLQKENVEQWVCKALGFFLHWALLATFSWMLLEGFHLYLLLVRVFNIYVRRYLLKLSLVGWGLPTLIAVVCGISGVYGKYSLELRDTKNRNSTVQMCWMSSEFPQRLVVSFITTVAFPCLVILYNSCMLGVVVFKLWKLRQGNGSTESRSSGKKMTREKGLWKDCATVLGLSCVLGLPWGLASTTYLSLPGIYIFTILNSLQGVFVFLWSVALTYKSRSDNNSSLRDQSTQKMMTTSFSN
uniref:Adhesion G protein-coupled receptor G3 n=1 Tax=Monopterus albus TaxID=43700 RepID=A0A3Q3K6R4_MONAL|nr:adhesion G-protein coupled receptor G1-like [Monopterus albus]